MLRPTTGQVQHSVVCASAVCVFERKCPLRYLVWLFTLTLSRSNSKAEVIGHRSQQQIKLDNSSLEVSPTTLARNLLKARSLIHSTEAVTSGHIHRAHCTIVSAVTVVLSIDLEL